MNGRNLSGTQGIVQSGRVATDHNNGYDQCGRRCFTKGLGLPKNTAKSFGFCFYAGQDKNKTKRFWLQLAGKASARNARTEHSRDR